MSSIWTPGGERPIRREPEPTPPTAAPFDDDDQVYVDEDGQELSPEEVQARMATLQQQLAETPAAEIVANHCFGLFELAALHLSLAPPNLADASIAIDALNGIVEALPGRLGEHEAQLKEGLASLKLAFVQIRAASLGQGPPPA